MRLTASSGHEGDGAAKRAETGAWPGDAAPPTLTRRESEVLRSLAAGNCNKLIARELGIAVATVKTHVKHLFRKLCARSRTQLLLIAIQRGLLNGEIHRE